MDREKEIQDLARALWACQQVDKDGKLDFKGFASNLIYCGYRKVDEVRKETAKDVVEKAKYESAMTFKKQEHIAFCEMLDRVLKEYGVEV